MRCLVKERKQNKLWHYLKLCWHRDINLVYLVVTKNEKQKRRTPWNACCWATLVLSTQRHTHTHTFSHLLQLTTKYSTIE